VAFSAFNGKQKKMDQLKLNTNKIDAYDFARVFGGFCVPLLGYQWIAFLLYFELVIVQKDFTWHMGEYLLGFGLHVELIDAGVSPFFSKIR
jgi:hypothetical protein